jgi:hypothetical protein
VPSQAAPVPRSPAPAPAPDGGPPRRTAFAEGVDQLRAAATTEPGRLRIIGAVLALLVVAFGSVTAWQMNDRAAAADDVLHGSQPLSSAAAEIYSSLAAANTAASSGFLAGGQETPESREVYEREMGNAARNLAFAATASESGSDSEQRIAKLNALLPEYKGLVERARANNRLGYPLGGAYLRYANDKMQNMLGEAQSIYDNENERLRDDYADATAYPWAALGLGALAIGGLVWAQRRNYRRTNRRALGPPAQLVAGLRAVHQRQPQHGVEEVRRGGQQPQVPRGGDRRAGRDTGQPHRTGPQHLAEQRGVHG